MHHQPTICYSLHKIFKHWERQGFFIRNDEVLDKFYCCMVGHITKGFGPLQLRPCTWPLKLNSKPHWELDFCFNQSFQNSHYFITLCVTYQLFLSKLKQSTLLASSPLQALRIFHRSYLGALLGLSYQCTWFYFYILYLQVFIIFRTKNR